MSCVDKVHNARGILTDFRTHGSAVFDRFRGGREGTLWYYGTLADAFQRLMSGPLAEELAMTVAALEQAAT